MKLSRLVGRKRSEEWQRCLRPAMTAALGILFLPGLVLGQEPVRSFDQLNTRLKVGDKVYVTDAQGREREGEIVELSVSSLTLDTDGAKKLAVSYVRLVQERQHDSLKNGALIGLGVGAGLAGGLIVAVCSGDECEVGADWVLLAVGAYAGIGAAIGTGIDALVPGKKRVVYRAPAGGPSARLMLVPVLTPRTKGFALSLTF
jgi:hypothetical protein